MSQKLNDLVIAIDDFMTYGRGYDEHQIRPDLVLIIQLVSHERLSIELHYGTDRLIQKITREYTFSDLVGTKKITSVFNDLLKDLIEVKKHAEGGIRTLLISMRESLE